jgi:hypothetical protein
MDQYVHNGYNMDYQALPPSDPVGARVARFARRCSRREARSPEHRSGALVVRSQSGERRRARAAGPAGSPAGPADRLPLAELARVTMASLAPHNPSYLRLPLGWPGEPCDFRHPLDYIGFDGGGGIGSGPGMAGRCGIGASRRRPTAGRSAWRRRLPDGRGRRCGPVCTTAFPVLIVIAKQRIVLQRRAASGADGARAWTADR